MTWLAGFKPEMIIYNEGEATTVAAVCANRVCRLQNTIVLRKCKTEKERRFIKYGRWNETGTAYS